MRHRRATGQISGESGDGYRILPGDLLATIFLVLSFTLDRLAHAVNIASGVNLADEVVGYD